MNITYISQNYALLCFGFGYMEFLWWTHQISLRIFFAFHCTILSKLWCCPNMDEATMTYIIMMIDCHEITTEFKEARILWIMMMSSNRNIFRVNGPFCWDFTDDRWIPRPKASDAELWCFFDMHLNKRLRKQSWGRFILDAIALIMTSL